jgi:hypothetical protein
MGKMVTDSFSAILPTEGCHDTSPLHLKERVRHRTRGSGGIFRFWPHFWKSLAAILTGNALYFLLLAPHLPPVARHAPGRLDVGLLIDFWACLACFGVLELLLRVLKRFRV